MTYTRVELTDEDLTILEALGQAAQDFSGPADITRDQFDTWQTKWLELKPTYVSVDGEPHNFIQSDAKIKKNQTKD